uniref:Laminin subunit beta-2 n=1 Tax=Lepisosteus oculatus TaxID=7918 RepID=W5N6F6_LEPOC
MTHLSGIFILFLSVVAQELPSVPHGCTEGSCYPATGNLLIGRARDLTTTSTCGLQSPEHYCIVSHLQESDKCFLCDSQRPYDPIWHRNSHHVSNVIYLQDQNGDLTWWQSANGEENVSIRLNLEAEFHFTHLIMKFKTFRPAAMLIERSADFGRTWKPYRFFSYNCTKMFPRVPARPLQLIDDVICEERYSDIEPSTLGEVIYKVLDPAIDVKDPYSLEIQELLRITNLRINFTKLHTLGDNLLDRRTEVLQKYYYALYELVVRGSCFCYGHASECAPIAGITATVPGMIHGRCVCKHNTEGLNCEQCKDFYNDLPWSPAEADNPHTCRECNCNGHSSRCHFDMAVYQATGNVSGGVCDDCLHNTMGRNCEMCKPFYYQDPLRDIRDPAVCIPCDCDPVGSLDGGVCDSLTDLDIGMIAGQCRCKQNVKGTRCDCCKEGFYGLSQNDPLGCQPCNCDPRGIIMGGAPCDQISGDCSCKRYVTGRYCNQCLPEYWGLSNDIAGCRACDCDFGGAYNNRCLMENGQCDCRPHIIGRQCKAIVPQWHCIDLKVQFESQRRMTAVSMKEPLLPGKPRPKAETDCVEHLNNQLRRHRRHRRIANAQQQRAALRRIRQLQQTPDVKIVHRERSPGHMVTWTGPGFARVKDGAGLVFQISNIPFAMEYDIMIRYEPESTEDWEAIVSISSVLLPTSSRCGNVLSSEQMYHVTLPHQTRYVKMPRPFCFESNNRYVVAIRFQRHRASQRHLTAFILVDSLVLIPKYTELPGFNGNDPVSVHHREEMEHYMCLDSFMMVPKPMLAEMCTKLLCSISAILHDGALPCQCDPQGSLSTVCEKVGGQCHCKPNVIGLHCDRCAPGTFGFGPYGCIACDCHSHGSVSSLCDPLSGQCRCHHGATGRQCANCHPGHWGFPNCRPCQCNGHSESCDPSTGACINCRDYTAGEQCEGCMKGFYGNPVLGSGDHCRPCPCPGNPGSAHSNGESCYADPSSNQVICNCKQGYAGPRCDRCASGYFGNPERAGGECRPCQCNGNIDTLDPGSCDPRTGQCLKCLYNTDGPTCGECRPGYYGNALIPQNCRRCTCAAVGTLQSQCQGDLCYCDKKTGACPCRPSVIGQNCDQCAPQHWNLGRDLGCEPCACHLQHSLRADCNMFTGQCHCRPGFGGRVCSECQEDYWGDPTTECKECSCDPFGAEISQCDRQTGHCQCREGATGPRCDQCSRGFTGNFPKCVRCHPCFDQWDGVVSRVWAELERVREQVKKIQATGITSSLNDARIRDLEKKLENIQRLIDDRASEKIYPLVKQYADDLRAAIDNTDGRLMGIFGDLNSTMQKDRKQLQSLDLLETDLGDLNSTVAKLRRRLESLITAGITEQFEEVRKYYKESLGAERRCNGSVSGPDSPVGQSQETRRRAEDLMKKQADKFQRTMAAHKKSLKELQDKSKDMNKKVHQLSRKVCGSTSGQESCTDSTCGGAGCRDEQGQLKCGGVTCNGTVGTSVRTLKLVNDIAANMSTANDELQNVAKKLQDIEMLMQEVKTQAKGALEKAQKNKEDFVNSNKKLKEFIQKIRDFLTEEGADPGSIELVAQQVLAISLPVNGANIAREIKDSIANLTDVEKVFNTTSQQLRIVEELLQNARDAKTRAEGVKGLVNETKMTLDDAKTAAESAEKALRKAQKNINSAQNATDLVKHVLLLAFVQILPLKQKKNVFSFLLSIMKNKESNLHSPISLRNTSSSECSPSAQGEIEQEMENVEQKFKELQKKVDGMNGGSGAIDDIDKKLKDIKKDAEDLLNKANNGMTALDDLEKRYRINEKRMQEQRDELADLERNVTSIRDIIREHVTQYNTCIL